MFLTTILNLSEKNKFSKDEPIKADKDCNLGMQTASNQHNEKKYEFYWGLSTVYRAYPFVKLQLTPMF